MPVGSLVRSWEGGAGRSSGFEDIGLVGNAVRTELASRCWLYSAAGWVSWLMPVNRAGLIDGFKATTVWANKISHKPKTARCIGGDMDTELRWMSAWSSYRSKMSKIRFEFGRGRKGLYTSRNRLQRICNGLDPAEERGESGEKPEPGSTTLTV
ncbi:unnamed protein product [Fusarium venenatum]|uniref:Uncharacterized protein n=1 Tax=Fusarium venenatum TaxID=56646 RepID=A0A2L2TFY9_9HYPO|nr:uncharacterized protein FVRRES_13163 [Fusarium venenatum]CEI40546.1 unnamed protein product [Fusarium venenatum]